MGGNDFKVLPQNFSKLENLQELFLDNESNLALDENLKILAKLPRLKTLHLENDKLIKIPGSIGQLKTLENLYLSNNLLRYIPNEVNSLKNLKYLDLNNNPIHRNVFQKLPTSHSFKIKF